jgi:hypothetical protein
MKIDTTPENIAVLGNVSDIGEFKIKNSSKAFSILSSGLYGNKIRAIIRELSCNAYDSHVAAGKKTLPFDLHLPTMLEPYFYIRDYGTGLTHDQVVNIYTTYFESTKTNSNDFIGALGLGSKSPFSYTDNFTVTAIKNGTKGIYSAFINNMGVPSIALMSTNMVDEPDGVEVKFAVDIKNDHKKFISESENVFLYFDTKPNLTGAQCSFDTINYHQTNIVDGINIINSNHKGSSVAIMGNISYPIAVPNEETNLGNLHTLLSKNLEIRFDIGDLEFQASREGLSYTKQTIAAIKNKLQILNDKLSDIFTKEADTYTNLWDSAHFIIEKSKIPLWKDVAKQYLNKKKMNGLLDINYGDICYGDFTISIDDLEKLYNLKIVSVVTPNYIGENFSYPKLLSKYDPITKCQMKYNIINPSKKTYFVKYDTKRGALDHVKHHINSELSLTYNTTKTFHILIPAKYGSPILYEEFFNFIKNPPKTQILEIGELLPKPKIEKHRSVYSITTLFLKETHNRGKTTIIWETAGDINNLDKSKNYYYIPLKGFAPMSMDGYPIDDVKELWSNLKSCGISKLNIPTIYGVRSSDIEAISKMKNWINLQQFIIDTIKAVDVDSLIGSYAKSTLRSNVFNNEKTICKYLANDDSDYVKFMNRCSNPKTMSVSSLIDLCKVYGGTVTVDTFMNKIKSEVDQFIKKYPLLQHIEYRANLHDVASYINMVDNYNNLITT